ncbi:MAG TPA: L-erythro-3,5-diaminohexanoate dehydrogenase [Bacillota bacterium]|nr:L-erythro-3,5-diaminohexanoate dehydrogenase [Bacillota bacterium]HOB42190.1 L-erythro-3,5-diaminohexanoate dehydrogenase [Bacillota bacterium]HOK71537.1 L-erythro-3,5-diaminohexanoate dehydrogenase [Bacillota bacterium]HPQ02776.1 L-erythro-3,5-diaminohexanoate dehydrogenase [Bacillota bacterium]HPZ13116.1 L-erythro-3,5-diaminohexanoate dehydrogenase [Bacillota bacterium]
MAKGCKYGTHRVIEPEGSMPQAAWKIDNEMAVRDNEILINVQTLNIDAASFTQIKKQAGNDEKRIGEIMMGIVADRGKHHNPVTGSGGMLIGTVEKIGPDLIGSTDLEVGDRIATLVSLTLTPLVIDKIIKVHLDTDQVDIEGHAILFESGIYAKLPNDMPDSLSLAVLDVAGAPAQTAKLVHPGDTVLIIGAGGKSGLLCMYEAKKRAGVTGKVIALAHSEASKARAEATGFADVVIAGDATRPLEIMKMVEEATGGKMADVTINCVNIPGTEMSSILSTRDMGIIYFFSMATSFTAAALGAEGVGRDVTMIIGNGYTRGHAEIALETLRESPKLRKIFEDLYAR